MDSTDFLVLIKGHGDTNWIINLYEMECTIGFIFIHSGGVVSWKSSEQTFFCF